ncbi:MAG: SET domain-containing protein-lysine N-methyltransferase [Puniceicoccales bacterium]|jgi:SET domain-containing protein|nr:SET domain-containing protein-lysine N-methyltransferase [Puniceicoccales bacterium]
MRSTNKTEPKRSRAHSKPPPFEIHKSAIHGTGVFAVRDIAAGERIGEYKGERITKKESLRRAEARVYSNAAGSATDSTTGSAAGDDAASERKIFIFSLNRRFDLDGDVPENLLRFTNHSCDENCEVVLRRGHLWLVARRDIAAGEELTFDYGFSPAGFFEHPCRCGAAGCTGYIVAKPERTRLRILLARRRNVRAPAATAASNQNSASQPPPCPA